MLKRPLLNALVPAVFVTPLALTSGGFGWVWAVLGISFLIAVHEWGHYMACVLTKTRTETFSIGFGPRLFGWERDKDGKRRFTLGARQLDPLDHSMDFRIAAIPLGGYVKMAGGEIIGESTSTDPNEFVNKSASARMFIICAGVIMNAITAFVLFALSFGLGKPVRPPVIGAVEPGGPAWRAGLMPGDAVSSVDATRTRSWLDVKMEIVLGDRDERSKLIVDREGTGELELTVLPEYQEEGGFLAIEALPATELTIGEGDAAVTIGFRQEATINGWPVRGGTEALETLTTLLVLGAESAEVVTAEKTATVRLAKEGEAKDGSGKPRVGIEPFTTFTVDRVRAPVDKHLQLGDVLVGVVSQGTTHAIESQTSLERARMRSPIEAILVKRDGSDVRVDVTITTPAEGRAFFTGFGVEGSKQTNRIRPLAAGHLAPDVDGIWRYPSSPASDAGIGIGDQILRIGDAETPKWTDIYAAIKKATPGKPLDMVVRTAGQAERNVTVTPVALEYAGTVAIAQNDKVPFEVDGVGDALAVGVSRTWREVKNVFRTIGGLFSGNISFNKNIAGPITLITASKDQAAAGITHLFWFLGYISVMLAVLNILPIPVLDGGHALFIIIEKIKGSPLKESVVVKFMYIGLFLLLTLMVFAFKNDIVRILER